MTPPPSTETVADLPADPPVVERSVDLDADLADVWRALTDPDALAGWLGADVHLDLRPGGTGVVRDPDGSTREVLVTDVDEPNRIAWHWWHEAGHLSRVEITVAPTATGTRVRVVEVLDTTTLTPPTSIRAKATSGGRTMAFELAGASASVADAWSTRLDRLGVMTAATSGSLALVG